MVLRAKTTAGRFLQIFDAKLQGLAVLLSILLLPRKQPQRFHVGIWYLVFSWGPTGMPCAYFEAEYVATWTLSVLGVDMGVSPKLGVPFWVSL